MLRKNICFILCIFILSLVFLFWLISPMFFEENWKGDYQEPDPDCLLFARLLEQSFLKGRVIENDSYAAFPYEINTGFAPFYLTFLYYFTNGVYAFFPNITLDPIHVAGCLPVIIPWLTSLAILFSLYLLTNDKTLTIFCAFGMLPGFSWAMVGGFYKFDYDFIISAFIWIWLLSCSFYIKCEKHIFAYIGASVTFLFISTWLGSPLFYGLVTIYGFIIWFLRKEEYSKFLDYTSFSMFIGGGLAGYLAWKTDISFANSLSIQVGRYSFLYGAIVCLGGGFVWILKNIDNKKKSRFWGWVYLFFAGILLFVLKPDFFYQATGILFKRDPIHNGISELLSIVFSDEMLNSESIRLFNIRLGPIFLFCPILFLADWSKFKKDGLWLVRDWLGIFILMAVYQIRYIRWPGCGFGVIHGFLLYFLWHYIKAGLGNVKFLLVRVSIILIPVMLFNSITNFLVIEGKGNLGKSLVGALTWLREKTPKTSGYSDEKTPEYGVLTDWDNGNYVSFYAKRPAVVSNSFWGFRTMADVFSSKNELEAFELTKKYRIKYILIEPKRVVENRIFDYWRIFKDMPETPVYSLYYKEVPEFEDSDKCFYNYLCQNLALTSMGDFEPGTRFRIVFCSETNSKDISNNVIFERVEGADVNFNLKPHSTIELSLQIILCGNSFLYKRKFGADEKGNCSIKLPYSTSYDDGNVVTDEYYKLAIEEGEGNKRLASLIVTDEEVVEGKGINLEKSLNYLSISK